MAAAADSLTAVALSDGARRWVVVFRSADGAVHATNGNGWWTSSSDAPTADGGRTAVAQAGSISALILPGGRLVVYFVHAVAQSLHEMFLPPPPDALPPSVASDSLVPVNLTSKGAGAGAEHHASFWSRAAPSTAVCSVAATDGTRRVYFVGQDGGINQLARGAGGWAATRVSDVVGMTIDVIPQTLACLGNPYPGTAVVLFFVSPPVAPRSCSHATYSASCRSRLHELRLSDW